MTSRRSLRRCRWLIALLACAPIARGVAVTAPPDDELATRAKIALLTADGVRASALSVDAVGGELTVHGQVGTALEKQRAEAALRIVPGVRQVRSLLQVVPDRTAPRRAPDGELTSRVRAALRKRPTLEGVELVEVQGGTARLAGRATLEHKLLAIETALGVPGVRGVASEIQPLPGPKR